MSLPEPRAGLVIRYSYLWHREARVGREEGVKDRPCAVVLATRESRVAVVPLTTRPPSADTAALELPASIAKSMGLGERTCWIVVDEVNLFTWPGPDLRPATRDRWSFGLLPPGITKTLVEGVRRQRERLMVTRR